MSFNPHYACDEISETCGKSIRGLNTADDNHLDVPVFA